METKTRKTTMIGAALAVAIIALAGAGYAAVTYQATTTNSGNAMEQTYIKMTQSGEGTYSTNNFLENIYFNSVDNNETVTFIPVKEYVLDDGTKVFSKAGTGVDPVYALASKSLQLVITPENNDATSVELKVTTDGFTIPTGLTYWMAIGTTAGNGAHYALGSTNGTWDFTSVAITKDAVTTLTVQLYVTGSYTTGWQNITDASFTFTAIAESVDAPVSDNP